MRRGRVSRRWILAVVFVLAVVFLVLVFHPAFRGIRVMEVTDGDTIVLKDGEEVRYIGIDTPERDDPFFREATQANKEMLKGGRIRLEYDRDRRDRYGRLLAYVWVDTLLLNAELIKKGLASVYLFSPNLKYRDRFIAVQREARQKEKGIWSIPVEAEAYYVASRRSGRFVFHRPECGSAKKIKRENLMRFETRDEALDSGYSPCRNCKP
ncbi:MAG: thermonuclease family protein [Candidatus Zixiibacteriota bacterium]|nr:MAG: thermonuclease family protein [candidate division Zixibacteria bacterium]